MFGRRGGGGQSRLDSSVEAIIHEKIDRIFLAKRRGSAEEVLEAVRMDIDRENSTRIPSERLELPSLRTVQRRIAAIPAYDLCVARYGKREAERRFSHMLGSRRVQRILEIVEIDHSPVDLLVTDANGVVLGRPTITVVLDRYSRCLLGYHLSLSGHGVAAVFAALKHAILPKTYLHGDGRYADLKLDWECFGWFEIVLMDNGPEFHGEAIADALVNICMIAEFARSYEPNDKPHVERFLKTLNYSFIHRLPGTTLAKVGDRIGFKSEDEACMTLKELDRAIHVWVCDKYHKRKHAGLD
jgi:putative transposase